MRIYPSDRAICFSCVPEYFEAVAKGEKTAEVRLLDHEEFGVIMRFDPKVIVLESTDTADDRTFDKDISYWHEIGKMVGKHLVLFCWREPS